MSEDQHVLNFQLIPMLQPSTLPFLRCPEPPPVPRVNWAHPKTARRPLATRGHPKGWKTPSPASSSNVDYIAKLKCCTPRAYLYDDYGDDTSYMAPS